MYVDSIKIGNANARAIRTVVDLEAVPTQVFENSPMLIKVGETLYVKNKVVGNIIGTWHLKDTISYATNVGVNFDFVSNDTTYTAFLWQNSELHYASQATSDVVVYNSSGWVNQAYRTIVIKSGENADLLAFLQASAEKLIDGYYYYTAVSGGAVIEKYTQDMENFADIVFTANEFNTILNSDSVVVKLNIANIQNIFFEKTTQVADGSGQDIIYLNSYVATAGANFVLGLVKPHDSTQVAHIVSKQTLPEPPTAINLNDSSPSTATNGTLTSKQLRTLQASDSNYIVFNNELFRLNDKQHNEGYLVYSHNGHDTTGCFFQKCITITISTLGWVLETQENQAKLTAGSGITIENNVISATGGGGSGAEKRHIPYISEIPQETDTAFVGAYTVVPYDVGSISFNQKYRTPDIESVINITLEIRFLFNISSELGLEDGVYMCGLVKSDFSVFRNYYSNINTEGFKPVKSMSVIEYQLLWLSKEAANSLGFANAGFYVSIEPYIYYFPSSS